MLSSWDDLKRLEEVAVHLAKASDAEYNTQRDTSASQVNGDQPNFWTRIPPTIRAIPSQRLPQQEQQGQEPSSLNGNDVAPADEDLAELLKAHNKNGYDGYDSVRQGQPSQQGSVAPGDSFDPVSADQARLQRPHYGMQQGMAYHTPDAGPVATTATEAYHGGHQASTFGQRPCDKAHVARTRKPAANRTPVVHKPNGISKKPRTQKNRVGAPLSTQGNASLSTQGGAPLSTQGNASVIAQGNTAQSASIPTQSEDAPQQPRLWDEQPTETANYLSFDGPVNSGNDESDDINLEPPSHLDDTAFRQWPDEKFPPQGPYQLDEAGNATQPLASDHPLHQLGDNMGIPQPGPSDSHYHGGRDVGNTGTPLPVAYQQPALLVDQDSADKANGKNATEKDMGPIQVTNTGYGVNCPHPTTGQWVPAVRHHDIRDHLYSEAAPLGSYDIAPAAGYDAYDKTSYVSAHRTWGPERQDRPDICFVFDRPVQKLPPHVVPDSQPVSWFWNKYIVLDHEDKPMRKFSDCPDTLSSCVEGFRIDAIQKRNRKIKINDLLGRLPREQNIQLANGKTKTVKLVKPQGLTNVAMRWRVGVAGVLCFAGRSGSDKNKDILTRLLTKQQLQNNTTHGGQDFTKAEKNQLMQWKQATSKAEEQDVTGPDPQPIVDKILAARSSTAGPAQPSNTIAGPIMPLGPFAPAMNTLPASQDLDGEDDEELPVAYFDDEDDDDPQQHYMPDNVYLNDIYNAPHQPDGQQAPRIAHSNQAAPWTDHQHFAKQQKRPFRKIAGSDDDTRIISNRPQRQDQPAGNNVSGGFQPDVFMSGTRPVLQPKGRLQGKTRVPTQGETEYQNRYLELSKGYANTAKEPAAKKHRVHIDLALEAATQKPRHNRPVHRRDPRTASGSRSHARLRSSNGGLIDSRTGSKFRPSARLSSRNDGRMIKSLSRDNEDGFTEQPRSKSSRDYHKASPAEHQITVELGLEPILFPVGEEMTVFATTDENICCGIIKPNGETELRTDNKVSDVLHAIRSGEVLPKDYHSQGNAMKSFKIASPQLNPVREYTYNVPHGYEALKLPIGASIIRFSSQDTKAQAGVIAANGATVWNDYSRATTIAVLEQMNARVRLLLPEDSQYAGKMTPTLPANHLPEQKTPGSSQERSGTSNAHMPNVTTITKTTPLERTLTRDELMMLWEKFDGAAANDLPEELTSPAQPAVIEASDRVLTADEMEEFLASLQDT